MVILNKDRREFIEMIVGASAALLSCTCANAFPGVPEERPSSSNDFLPTPLTPQQGSSTPASATGERTPGAKSLSSIEGCSFHAANAGGAGQIKLLSTTGLPALDMGINNEYVFLVNYFKVKPGFFMFDDGGHGNAFATEERLGGHGYADGTVLFGMKLVTDEFQSAGPMGRADHAMAGIMAHEWGHILQFRTLRSRPRGKRMELHADTLSGWYMGVRARQLNLLGGQVDVRTAMNSFFNKGDYAFNSPGHHGTPDERLRMFSMGVQMGYSLTPLGRVFQEAGARLGLS